MRCRGDLERNRPADRTPGLVSLLCFLAAVLLVGPAGCVYTSESTAGTVEIDVVPGETASGHLFSGQTFLAAALVEAGHVYEIRASLTVSIVPTELGEMEGVVSGAPLAGPVAFPIGTSAGVSADSEPGNTLVAQLDGEVTIEFAFPASNEDALVSDNLEAVRDLITGPIRATYELLLTDLGFDDNGASPENATRLSVGPEGERTGTLTPGDEADYFLLAVQAETTYQLTLEATESVNLTLGFEDRFGQINFGVPTAGGLTISLSASPGLPGVSQFAAPAEEEVILRLAPSAFDPASDVTIQYALSVIEVVPEEIVEEPGPPA